MKVNPRLLYKIPLLILLFVIGLFLTGFVFPILQISFEENKSSNYRNRIKIYWMRWFSWILNLKITRHGEAVPGAAMLVGNHVSWIDILVLGQFVPGYFVAKSDIRSWPVFGFISHQVGAIFIHRGSKRHVQVAAEQMVRHLQEERKVFVFPEGTTSDGKQLLPFHSSLFQPALQAGVPVQPFAISYKGAAAEIAPYYGDDVFMTHILKSLCMDSISVTLTFKPAIESANNKRKQLSDYAYSQINGTLFPEQTK